MKPADNPSDGGPAFPAEGGSDSGLHPAPGMSLRDWFAGQALAHPYTNCGVSLTLAVERAYQLADAMLKARGEVTHETE